MVIGYRWINELKEEEKKEENLSQVLFIHLVDFLNQLKESKHLLTAFYFQFQKGTKILKFYLLI